jgi:hypothetical protein
LDYVQSKISIFVIAITFYLSNTDCLINSSTYSEKVLLCKVAAGDENAFAELFKNFYNPLGEFVMRLTESEALTQEIVQDVFLKIWINRVVLAEIDCFKAYLLVVARNHAFNCLKQIARENSRKKEWVNTVIRQAANDVETVKKHMVLALRFLKHHLRKNSSLVLYFTASFFEA